MTKHSIKNTHDLDVLCRSMYDTIRSFMSECCIAVWIPAGCILPEWIPRFEAHELHLELYEKHGSVPLKLGIIRGEEQKYEYLVRNERR